MASKHPQGNDIYDLLIDLIMGLTPKQAKVLYSNLLPQYTKRAKVKLYDENGEENPEGKVRLTPSQYRAIRTNYGDTYMKRAFKDLTNYIKYLEEHVNDKTEYKSRLKKYNSQTHNILLTQGWVYDKHKDFIIKDRPTINVNPFLIEDFVTAKKYIESIPESMRDSMDVQMLLLKFPTLLDE